MNDAQEKIDRMKSAIVDNAAMIEHFKSGLLATADNISDLKSMEDGLVQILFGQIPALQEVADLPASSGDTVESVACTIAALEVGCAVIRDWLATKAVDWAEVYADEANENDPEV